MLAQCNVTFPYYYNQEKNWICVTILYLLIKVPRSYSSDDTILKDNNFFGNTVFRVTWHSSISIRFVSRYCVCSYKTNICIRVICNFCCTSTIVLASVVLRLLCLLLLYFAGVFSSSGLFILVDVTSSIMILLPWNFIPCNLSNSFCTCSGITTRRKPLFFLLFQVGSSTRQFSCKYVVALKPKSSIRSFSSSSLLTLPMWSLFSCSDFR